MVYISLKEYNLSINDFKEPTVTKDSEAIGVLLVRLLLLEPGTIESHPNMGVGLHSTYRYGVEGQALKLQTAFKEQIQKYLPWFQTVDIKVIEKKHQINILARIDESMVSILYDNSTGSITNKVVQLNDIKI